MQRKAVVEVRRHDVGIEPDRKADLIFGRFRLPTLQKDQAQQRGRIEMRWLGQEDRTADVVRFRKLATTLKIECPGELVVQEHPPHYGGLWWDEAAQDA